MSAKDNFSAQEWFTVLTAPARAGGAVVAASPSGVTGLVAEAQAMMQATRSALSAQGRTPLLEAMAADLMGQVSVPEESAENPKTLAQAQELALEAVRQAIWLVATKATPADLSAYKALIMQVGEATAQAAKEGGVFGIGGELVNSKERAVLEQLKALTSSNI